MAYNVPMRRKLPLIFSPQPEGGFIVTSRVLAELLTEGDTLDEAYANVSDALAAVVELYTEQGRSLRTRMHADRAAFAGGSKGQEDVSVGYMRRSVDNR